MNEKKSRTSNHTTPQLPDAPWDVQQAFEQRCTEAEPLVHSFLRRFPQIDHALVISQVREGFWRTFPEKYGEEQAALAAGRSSPHKWSSLICTIARRRAADQLRRVGPYKRVRPSRANHVAESTSPAPHDSAPTGDGGATPPSDAGPAEEGRQVVLRDTWEVPLHPDHAAPSHSDPLELLIRQESTERIRATLYESLDELARTSPRQHRAIQLFLDEVPDADAAKQLQTSRSGLYHLRRAGVLSLRRLFRARGYAVCETNEHAGL